MKRLISIFVMVTMLTLPTLSSYAAASFHDYIPEIPNFFTVSSGKITFNVPIGNAPDAKKFYDSFYSDGKPYLNVDTDKDGKPDRNVDTNGDGKPDSNLKPDAGSGEGSSGTGGGNYPVFPGIPGLEDYQFHDPFKKPS